MKKKLTILIIVILYGFAAFLLIDDYKSKKQAKALVEYNKKVTETWMEMENDIRAIVRANQDLQDEIDFMEGKLK